MARMIIGVKAFQLPSKQEALLFDKLVLVSRLFGSDKSMASKELYWEREYQYLVENGVIADYRAKIVVREHHDERSQRLLRFLQNVKKRRSIIVQDHNRSKLSIIKAAEDDILYDHDWLVRAFCIILEVNEGNWVGVLHRPPLDVDNDLSPSKREKVCEIVLRSLPVPSEITPWEQIVDFRNDPEARGRFSALKLWIYRMIRSEVNKQELEGEFMHLIHQYESYMKLYRLKYKHDVLKTFFAIPFEISENLVKIRWKDAASSLFSVRERKLNLMEKELTAPGREVSYVVLAREQFRSR